MMLALTTSLATPLIVSSAPVNVTPCVVGLVSGTGLVGEQVTVSTPGVWDDGAATLSYQWRRNGLDIGGATANTYTLTTDDASATVTVVETATGVGGSASQPSSNSVVPLALFGLSFDPTSSISAGSGTAPDTLSIASNGTPKSNPPSIAAAATVTARQWYYNGSATGMGTDTTQSATDPGDYYLVVTWTSGETSAGATSNTLTIS